MRSERMERLESEIKNLMELADNLGRRMENTRRKKYLKPKSLETIEKKLENEKMEVIFAQVKRGIESEKLDVTSESVLKLRAGETWNRKRKIRRNIRISTEDVGSIERKSSNRYGLRKNRQGKLPVLKNKREGVIMWKNI